MTDKPRDLGDWQSAVDAYVAAGYSKEGAEAAIDQHGAIVASHIKSPKEPLPQALIEPVAEDGRDTVSEPEDAPEPGNPVPVSTTEGAKEEEPV